jgi:alpha-glucosidase (family GH31 glycosyl hydrolase)
VNSNHLDSLLDFLRVQTTGKVTALEFSLPQDRLKTTENSDPYRLYSVDKFPHENFKKDPLYSSIPYVMGHNSNQRMDAGIIWHTGSETWVDIYNDQMEITID